MIPETKETATKLRDMLGKLDKELRLSFLHYIVSGRNIFSQTDIEEELEFASSIGVNQYAVRVKKVSSFTLDSMELC